jgi:hypothetical protein
MPENFRYMILRTLHEPLRLKTYTKGREARLRIPGNDQDRLARDVAATPTAG